MNHPLENQKPQIENSFASVIESGYTDALDTRLASYDAYIEYQTHEARRALSFLARFFDLTRARVLEIGAGRGGKGIAYARAGVHITALDVDGDALALGALAARQRDVTIRFLASDGARLPFPANAFDAILLDSVIEHVRDPQAVLCECARVLKTGGGVFVVFPPFYGPLSGHIDDYILIPWFHLLPRRVVERALMQHQPLGILTPRDAFAVYTTLNGLTTFDFRRFARRAGFRFEYWRARPFLTHPGTRFAVGLLAALRQPPRAKNLRAVFARARREFSLGTFALFILLSALAPLVFVPFLQEFSTGAVKCVLRK
ncbi:MAG: class I SAM-dependent methyltransferase [Chloroflexi bacterium]|nr:class I SAM-dependent methyltransferase [Chloroflexota bacterium]